MSVAKRVIDSMEARFDDEGKIQTLFIRYSIKIELPELEGEEIERRFNETFVRDDLSSKQINELESFRGSVAAPVLNSRKPFKPRQRGA